MKTDNLSTHEKQLLEQRARIEEVERENLGAKSWTMQGEVQNLIFIKLYEDFIGYLMESDLFTWVCFGR